MRQFIARLAVIAALSQTAAAQEVRGAVLDSASRQPVPGAVLMLLDSAGTVLGRNITNQLGQFRLALAGDGLRARAIRVLRIGFRPREVALASANDGVQELVIRVTPLPTLLEPVRVLEQPNCQRRSDQPAALALWEQAQTAFLAAVVSRESNPATMLRVIYARRAEGSEDRLVSQTARLDSSDRSTKSFYALRSAADFVRLGFRLKRPEGMLYLGPDAEVLLDDDFLTGYCLHLAAPSAARPNQVGLGFTAANQQRDRVDIAGTVWIDTVARALRDVEFRYVGLDRKLDDLRPGGRMEFRDMPNGSVLLTRWGLRVVGLDSTLILSRGYVNARTTPYAEEDGGELALARWPDGTSWRDSLGTLRVHAALPDRSPAVGMRMALDGTEYRATTDANGDLEIANIVPGQYSMLVTDRRLEKIGLTLPTGLQFVAARDSTVHATLTVPVAEEFVGNRCAADGRTVPGDSTWLLLRVMTPAGKPVSDIKVSLRQEDERGSWVRVRDEYETGSDGLVALCRGLRANANVMVEIRVGTDHADTLVQLNSGLTVAVVPFRTSRP